MVTSFSIPLAVLINRSTLYNQHRVARAVEFQCCRAVCAFSRRCQASFRGQTLAHPASLQLVTLPVLTTWSSSTLLAAVF
eukprot:1145112-Pelagomonas_calceolata.AAC.19